MEIEKLVAYVGFFLICQLLLRKNNAIKKMTEWNGYLLLMLSLLLIIGSAVLVTTIQSGVWIIPYVTILVSCLISKKFLSFTERVEKGQKF